MTAKMTAKEIEHSDRVAQLSNMTIVQLKSTASDLGVKLNRTQRTKATIIAALIEALKLNEKPVAKKASKRCTICNTRPVNKAAMRKHGTPDFDYCEPCIEEANWENEHSDNGHEGMAELTLDQTNLKTEKALDEFKSETLGRMADCWVCHPELNKASESYVSRAGTSRQGMIMNTKRSQTGEQKAIVIGCRVAGLSESKFDGMKIGEVGNVLKNAGVKIRRQHGIVTLKSDSLTLVWDDNGRYDYAASSVTVNGKTRKARNVSEVLRLMAV